MRVSRSPSIGGTSVGVAILPVWRVSYAGLVPYAVLLGISMAFFFSGNAYLQYLFNITAIAAVAAVALNLITGVTGQISLAHGALLGLGGYTAGILVGSHHVPVLIAMMAAGLVTALVGGIIGLPGLRLRGLYFALATIAGQVLLEYLFKNATNLTGGVSGLLVPAPVIFGVPLANDRAFMVLSCGVLLATISSMRSLLHSKVGRGCMAIRDNELAAQVMGVNIAQFKLWAFAISSFYTGLAGALMGFYFRIVHPEAFTLFVSIEYVAMIIVGGLGSVMGGVLGAVFVMIVPEVLQRTLEAMQIPLANKFFALREMLFGAMIITFLIVEPRGVAAIAQRLWAAKGVGSLRKGEGR